MNSFTTSLLLGLLLIGLTSALPNALTSVLKNRPDTRQPENTIMGEELKDLGIEICPDKLHLCPGTTKCCKSDDGKWDCCPVEEGRQASLSTISGDCCYQLGFIWTCCTSLVPKCHWWGCWWT